MEMNIRQAILSNIANNSTAELEGTIIDAIQTGEEKTLPGLGFLFELIWKQASESEKENMVAALGKGVKSAVN